MIITNLLKFNIARYSKTKQSILLCCLCFLFLALNISSLLLPHLKTLTFDEVYYYISGEDILSGKPSETKFDTANIMPASALYPLSSKFIREAIPDRFVSESTKNLRAIYFGRLLTIFVSLVLAIYVFCWARQLFGINAGFLALLLYILDPNIIAHSRVVHQDIFGACSVFVATYYFWNFLKFGGRKNAVLSIITFSIAQITRYTAVYLLPIYFVLIIGFYSSTILNLLRTRNFKINLSGIQHFCTYTILLLFTTILIINIGFSFEKTFIKLRDYQFKSRFFTSLQSNSPMLNTLPVPVPYAYLRGLDMGKYKQETGYGSGATYLMGRLGLENGEMKGMKEYFIIAFLYKVPIATQLLFFMAVAYLFRYRDRINFLHNDTFLIIPSILFFAVFSFSTAQLGIRYILMIFPFLYVFSSRLVAGWTTLRTRYRIFVVSLVAYLLVSNLSYFPHYLSYFNELLFNRKMAYTILADSNLDWDQNREYLRHYLKKHPEVMLAQSCRELRKKPKWKLPTSNVFNPYEPKAGLIVINANSLVGLLPGANPSCYQWIRENLKPVAHVAYSYLVFKIQPQDLPKLSYLNPISEVHFQKLKKSLK